MKASKWFLIAAMGSLAFSASPALAQDHGEGHGKGHEKHEDDRDDREEFHYSHHEKEIHGWYAEHEEHLPPGLAKKDRLSPGLERPARGARHAPAGAAKAPLPVPGGFGAPAAASASGLRARADRWAHRAA